ncbi:MAG: DUF2004 domain-containing protein [Flammeovirgaceae bacterium]|nr:DUF2004 domain-containing protein [Flammeovirgaceae bacterium]
MTRLASKKYCLFFKDEVIDLSPKEIKKMSEIYNHSLFGKINLEDLEEYYETEIKVNGKTIEVDLNFLEETFSKSDIQRLELINTFIEKASEYQLIAKDAITKDYTNKGATKVYLDHHVQEMSEEELNNLLKDVNSNLNKQTQMLEKLNLVSISFYPEDIDSFMILDHTIGRDLTQYVIVVSFDIEENLNEEVIMES